LRKLSKKELTETPRWRKEILIYDVVVKEYYWSKERKTFSVAADNEIEAVKIVRNQRPSLEQLYSVTLREGQTVWA
jgi:hypothetical protein